MFLCFFDDSFDSIWRKRLDEIVTELKQLTQATTIQGQQIKGLQEQDAIIHRRLNEHSARIHALEIKNKQ